MKRMTKNDFLNPEDWRTEFEIMIENFIADNSEELVSKDNPFVYDTDKIAVDEDGAVYCPAHDSENDYLIYGYDGDIILEYGGTR